MKKIIISSNLNQSDTRLVNQGGGWGQEKIFPINFHLCKEMFLYVWSEIHPTKEQVFAIFYLRTNTFITQYSGSSILVQLSKRLCFSIYLTVFGPRMMVTWLSIYGLSMGERRKKWNSYIKEWKCYYLLERPSTPLFSWGS